VFYSQVRGQHGHRYADLTQEPLFSFGFGLSYTTFRYDNLRVLTPELQPGQSACVEVEVTNTGERAGDEIAQLYISDEITSVTWVNKELKAFRRISLEPGETKTVRFDLPFEAFSLVDADGNRIVEPGSFQILAGGSSRTVDLLKGSCTVLSVVSYLEG